MSVGSSFRYDIEWCYILIENVFSKNIKIFIIIKAFDLCYEAIKLVIELISVLKFNIFRCICATLILKVIK